MKITILVFAVIGIITVIYTLIGLTIDIISFDQTKGGYVYPYEGWTGKPVDWDSMDRTDMGLVKRGCVLDVHVNTTTGMISFGWKMWRVNWRPFSERALKVHQPREAFERMGFKPEF